MSSVTRAHASRASERRRRPGGHKQPRALLSPPIGRRSFVRVDSLFLESVIIGQLTASELRSFLALLSYVARWRGECDPVDGTFPRKWVRFVTYARPGKGLGRVTPRNCRPSSTGETFTPSNGPGRSGRRGGASSTTCSADESADSVTPEWNRERRRLSENDARARGAAPGIQSRRGRRCSRLLKRLLRQPRAAGAATGPPWPARVRRGCRARALA